MKKNRIGGLRLGLGVGLLGVLGWIGLATGAEPEKPSPKWLSERLAERPKGDAADKLAEQVRAWFGKQAIKDGAAPKIDELEVAWALESPGVSVAPQVVSRDGEFSLPLIRIGDTDVYAATIALPNGTGFRWVYEVSGKRIERIIRPSGIGGADKKKAAAAARNADALEVYSTHPDSIARDGVPKGKLTQQAPWKSKICEDTTRDWWVYVPAQYKDDTPACVMVFQDGGGYKNYVPVIFDNLIARGEMPVTVGIFLNPGVRPGGRSDRSLEYDTLSDRYARFLLEEILPEVEKTVKLRHDPDSRAIAGSSSGGICAWTVAWERPDEFRKVLSWVGSFTNIASGKSGREGGHNYEAMIRKTDSKPIRVFLQDGANDLDNNNGNWPLANQQMAKALEFKQYDYKFVYGQGFHSGKHGQAILPDSLRWLWRDYKAK